MIEVELMNKNIFLKRYSKKKGWKFLRLAESKIYLAFY